MSVTSLSDSKFILYQACEDIPDPTKRPTFKDETGRQTTSVNSNLRDSKSRTKEKGKKAVKRNMEILKLLQKITDY